VDLGVSLIAAVGFFFVLAVCLVIVVLCLKMKETTDAILGEIQALHRAIAAERRG
jgi:hypothetical protein